ncbi:hypothetical protein Trydic_g22970 [Trypoxylus dichotomus]
MEFREDKSYYYHMKQSTLCSILNQVDINASPSDLIVIAIKWTVEECTLCDQEITHKNVWNILSEISTLHRPQKAESTSYIGNIRIKVTCSNCVCYNCLIEDQHLDYDHVQFINLPMPVKLEKAVSYNIHIMYYKESQFERGEVVLQYLGQKVADRRNSTVIQFNNELDGSVLQAVSFYPA